MKNDPLSDVRSIRRQISRQCHDRAEEVFDYYEHAQMRLKATGKYTFVNRHQDASGTILSPKPFEVADLE
jgi:hypothetical protein